MKKSNLLARVATIALVAGGLGACAQQGNYTSDVAMDSQIQADVSAKIAQSAERAANARETLAMIQRVRTPPVSNAVDETNLPPELKRPVKTISWTGPATELVREMAANVGYRFEIQGNPAPNQPMVNVEIHDVSAAQAFANVGVQVIPYATVIVNPNTHNVIFRFENRMGATAGEHVYRASAPRRHAPLVK